MTTNENKTCGFMVRCKCGVTARIEVPTTTKTKRFSRRVMGDRGWTLEGYTREVALFVFEGLEYFQAVIGGRPLCWACGKFGLKIEQVHGRFSDVHECNAKCLNSKGPNCECSCAGKNHGVGHRVI